MIRGSPWWPDTPNPGTMVYTLSCLNVGGSIYVINVTQKVRICVSCHKIYQTISEATFQLESQGTTTTTIMMMMMIIIIIVINNNNNCIQRRNSKSPHCAANCLRQRASKWPGRNRVQVMCNKSSAYHVQPATWYEGIRRDSSAIKFDRVEIAFILTLFYWLNHQPMKEDRKSEYQEKTPDDELQKMPHTKARKFKPLARLEPEP